MMKFLKSQWLSILAALGGVVMLLLRQIHLATINERGLLASFHYAGIITGILALLIPGILLWRCLVLAKGNTCKFPASIPATVGYGIGAVGLGITAAQFLLNQPDTLQLVLGFAGVVAAVALLLMAVNRFQGVKTNVLLHAVVCLFFMVLLIWQYRDCVMHTQLQICVFAPVATICLMIASYNRAAFEEKIEQPRLFVFFRLMSIFFCLTAIPGSELWVLYLSGCIWSVADLANLTVAPQEGG